MRRSACIFLFAHRAPSLVSCALELFFVDTPRATHKTVVQRVILLLAFAAGAEAKVQMESGITDFSRKTWYQAERVHAGDTLEVTFVVKSCPMKRAELEERFWKVSDPKHADYKKYSTLEELADALHPVTKGEVTKAEEIKSFLKAQEGLLAAGTEVSITKTRDLVSATLNAQAAELLLGTDLFHFRPKAGVTDLKHLDFIRVAAPYSLPDELAEKVAFVDKVRTRHARKFLRMQGIFWAMCRKFT